jgi:primosomal protein N' (replication factor Y)
VPKYADIAFPTAVRRVFTYEIPENIAGEVTPGVRIWVPLRKQFSIGVVIRTFDQKPDFKTRPIREVLDKKPILSKELLSLTEWVHQFYYCSWGEVIQAALPAGLNYVSKTRLRISEEGDFQNLSPDEQEILSEVDNENELSLEEARKRWKGTGLKKSFEGLLKKNVIEIWEEPDIKVTTKTERLWDWAGNKSEEAKELVKEKDAELNKWQTALEELVDVELPKRQSQLNRLQNFDSYTRRKLESDGWITFTEVEVQTMPMDLDYDPASIKILNEDQEKAFQEISESLGKQEFANYLLYGITGSGKTEVYIHALKQVRESGRGGIVLVPEIALTPQTVSRFYKVFGEDVAVLHSRMTNRERLRAWRDLKEGKKNIAIGPRSAVFAPVQNLGLVVLDEEHDASYKQIDPAPRYHARETAIMRCNLNQAVMIMGSATPSVQALNMSAKKKCRLLELKKRHAEAVLPEVKILDLKQYTGAMRGELAVPLFKAIETALEQKEQVILLFNRRGFANYLQCESCGHIPQSPECSVSLTYHKRKNILICHYSGYSRRADTNCEICGSDRLIVKGSGTQKIEESLEELFPKARVLRFDKDSTSRKGAHEKILNAFGEHEADIMIGTQLVAKGLDFPNVTVVGVVDADTEQAYPSFQSNERMYQLLSQVSGRSGRGEKPGKVFIQTRQPENSAIQFAKDHNHEGFAREEMGFRKPLNYPPYSRLINFVLKGKDEQKVTQAAHKLRDVVSRVVPGLDILGPSSSAIGWMYQNYFWELSLKIDPEKGANYIQGVLDKIMEVYENESRISTSVVRININVDAIR